MKEEKELKCIACGVSEVQVPIIKLSYQGKELGVCPQHMPVLIHKPQELVGKLEGADKFIAG